MKKLLLFGSLAFCLNVFGQVPSYVPTNGLIGWWPFNGNANDESGNGNNGTVNGATLTNDRVGNTNSAYNFSGSDDISANHSNSLNTLPISISVWFKTNTATLILPLVNKYPCGTYNGYSLHLYEGTPGAFYFGSNGTASDNKIEYGQTPPIGTTVNDGQWHNLAYTIDNNEIKYYLDGNLFFTGPWINGNGMVTDNTEPLYFGKYPTGQNWCPDYFYTGTIDDIGIWNRVLTQQEIAVLVNGINTTSIEEQTYANKALVKIVDFMGRETEYKPNTPLVFIYSDGTRERVMKIEE